LLNAFGPGDYGPSGEDVRHRLVLAGIVHLPGGFEVSTINQLESARPITITNANNTDRIYVNGNYTSLDNSVARPYIQSDLRVTRPFKINERWQVDPFIEFFNLFNRNNPGANFAVNVAQLPVPQNQMTPNSQASPTSPVSVQSRIAPKPRPSPASSSLKYPKARWEISSAPAQRLAFHSPRS
jgi:hypothetical protein